MQACTADKLAGSVMTADQQDALNALEMKLMSPSEVQAHPSEHKTKVLERNCARLLISYPSAPNHIPVATPLLPVRTAL